MDSDFEDITHSAEDEYFHRVDTKVSMKWLLKIVSRSSCPVLPGDVPHLAEQFWQFCLVSANESMNYTDVLLSR